MAIRLALPPAAAVLTEMTCSSAKLDRTTPDVFDSFADAVKRSDDVMECHMVAGGFDYLVKARVAGMEAYRQFLSEVILPLPGVRETHTYAVMEEVKSAGLLPV